MNQANNHSDNNNQATDEKQDPANMAIVPAKLVLPKQMGLVVVQHRPLFPNMVVPLVVEGQIFIQSLQYSLKLSPSYLAITLARPSFQPNKIQAEDFYDIGVIARVARVFNSNPESAQILLDVVSRMQIDQVTVDDKIIVSAHPIEEKKQSLNDTIRAFSREILNNMKELVKLNPLIKEELTQFISQINIEDPYRLADFAATLTSADRYDLQEILAELSIQARLEKTLLLIKKELELSRLQSKIAKQIEDRISKNQREYMLKEQLKEIKKELGLSKDEKSQEVNKFLARAAKLHWNENVQEVFQEELDKLQLLEPQSAEYGVTRSYLDWITSLPWGIYSPEKLGLQSAKRVLSADHYGLEDVKERILDLIASMAMRKQVTGKIICLVGPPGVGKTSIGKSIARSLNRSFYRFSLGGMRDEAEIKGHRRTYIGAMPGKVIQALKKTKNANPVIMLDEIDKLHFSQMSDPASALLEVLDPEQNSTFLDHYLDLPFDLSKILFVCTANQLDTIPGPLQDRMEIIRLPGYIAEEKLQIAKKYLVKKQLSENGLTTKQVTFKDSALKQIIENYARESGVRNLEKFLNKICQRVARDYLEKNILFPIAITTKEVEKYLKQQLFQGDELIGENKPGCVNGLAWTAMGGAVLNLEATRMPGAKGLFKQTGQLGKVMLESSEIAYSYVCANAQRLKIDEKKLQESSIHLHVPAGATPKDGPSAGITIALALVSMLLDQPVRLKLGMTGELSLTGEVLPIGGLREKIIAAKRSKLKEVILPKKNERDFVELPDHIKKGLKFYFISQFDELLPLCFSKSTFKKAAVAPAKK